MNKKGYLITIITVIMFLALVLLASTYSERLKANEEIYIKSTLGEKIRVIEGDVGVDFFDFWPMTVGTIDRQTPRITIPMSDIYEVAGRYGPRYSEDMEDYQAVVEGTYSKKSNAIVKLFNITAGFVIMPYNQTFTYDPANGNFFIYSDPANVNMTQTYYLRIDVTNRDKTTDVAGSSAPAKDTTGPLVKVHIKDEDGAAIGQATWENWQLDPYKTYPPFNLTFKDGMSLKVYFGIYNGMPGTFRIIRNQPDCCTTNSTWPRPVNLKFKIFDEEMDWVDQTVYVASKDPLIIDVRVDELKKEGRIVLATEAG